MKKIIWLLVAIIIGVVIYLQFFTEDEPPEPTEPPEILTFEGLTYVNSHDKNHIVRDETYIIKNPPNQLEDLKQTIEKFNEEHPVLPSESNEDEIVRRFLRLSNYTTMQWAKNNRKYSEGADNHWPVDSIAVVYWEPVGDTGEYEMVYSNYMKKNKKSKILRELAWSKPD